ncbi:MAG: DinB family protein, partial [Chloroflexota bacterium]
LTADQLETTVPGTFGSILDTLRHTVGADAAYLSVLSGGRVPTIDEATLDLAALRATMERHGPVWSALLEEDLDPDTSIVRQRDDGSTSTAPLGVRIAQVIHHGTDHRSQICTALTSLGLTPPEIDVWDLADSQGRLAETPATT